MILPDDVVSLISEYSRPLKRRIVSRFWVDEGIPDIQTMITRMIQMYTNLFDKDVWHILEPIWLHRITYTEDTLCKWNGKFAYVDRGSIQIILPKDKCQYEQLVSTKKIKQLN